MGKFHTKKQFPYKDSLQLNKIRLYSALQSTLLEGVILKNYSIDQKEVMEHLSYIKTLTADKQNYEKRIAPYFIIWGCIWMIGFLISATSLMSVTYIAWIFLAIVGWLFSSMVYVKQKGMDPTPKFLKQQFNLLWISFLCIFFIFIFFISSGLLPFSFHYLALYNILLVSILYLLLGIVLTKVVFFMGIWLAMIGITTYLFVPDFMPVIFAILGGGCLLFTGFLLYRKGTEK